MARKRSYIESQPDDFQAGLMLEDLGAREREIVWRRSRLLRDISARKEF